MKRSLRGARGTEYERFIFVLVNCAHRIPALSGVTRLTTCSRLGPVWQERLPGPAFDTRKNYPAECLRAIYIAN
jgi:hypothetical protein